MIPVLVQPSGFPYFCFNQSTQRWAWLPTKECVCHERWHNTSPRSMNKMYLVFTPSWGFPGKEISLWVCWGGDQEGWDEDGALSFYCGWWVELGWDHALSQRPYCLRFLTDHRGIETLTGLLKLVSQIGSRQGRRVGTSRSAVVKHKQWTQPLHCQPFVSSWFAVHRAESVRSQGIFHWIPLDMKLSRLDFCSLQSGILIDTSRTSNFGKLYMPCQSKQMDKQKTVKKKNISTNACSLCSSNHSNFQGSQCWKTS